MKKLVSIWCCHVGCSIFSLLLQFGIWCLPTWFLAGFDSYYVQYGTLGNLWSYSKLRGKHVCVWGKIYSYNLHMICMFVKPYKWGDCLMPTFCLVKIILCKGKMKLDGDHISLVLCGYLYVYHLVIAISNPYVSLTRQMSWYSWSEYVSTILLCAFKICSYDISRHNCSCGC